MRNSDLPARTTAPVAHKDRVEFLSGKWIDAAKNYLEPRVAESRAALAGQSLRVCEIYRNAPPHLGRPNNVAAFHFIIDDGELTMGDTPIEDCHFRVEGDYNKGLWVTQTVYDELPERRARVQRETQHLFGNASDVQTQGDFTPELSKVVHGLHDFLAKRTVGNPDVQHKLDAYGLERHVKDLDERGYAILEGAFSDAMADELTADLTRCIKETRTDIDPKRHVASMLLARGDIWQDIAIHPWVHTLAQYMLGADCNLGQSLGFTKPTGADTHQLHNDPPHPLTGDVCCNVTTIWALEDFTETSGPTVVVPGSHKEGRPPTPDAKSRVEKIIMPRGSVALWHGNLWHGSAIREDEGTRMTIHNTYLRNWVRTFDSYLEIDPVILEGNCPAIATLCGVDDLYGKNTFGGPDFARMQ
jgi:ectoine hydroxylase-related dioxygenase (phytanoyl-CoA dioxygenase family)